MHRRVRGLVVVILALLIAAIAVVAGGVRWGHATPVGASTPVYLDPTQPVAARVSDLLGRMTLDEKVGQMTLVSVSTLRGNCQGGATGDLSTSCMAGILDNDRVGNVLSGGGEAPPQNTPQGWAEMTNAIQQYAVQHSRLHIPVLYGADGVHGDNNLLGATIFPHNIGMGASRDPALEQQVAASTARTMRATGVMWTFSPVSDVARDLRWGRYYETFGEDPMLVSAMVSAAVQGYQGKDLSTGVAATLKHFLGYSEPLNGHDRVFAELPLRYLRDTFYPSFQAGIDAGAASVMVNSGSIDGIPAHASHFLLTDTLRGQMGFTGFTVSDWGDVNALYTSYHLATSSRDAIRLAVLAGVDMAMVPYDAGTFTHDLISLVNDGSIPASRIDEAVRRILTVKFELGLFDHPTVDASQADKTVLGADRTVALQAAEESLTLLRNQHHVLPLAHPSSLVVAGSAASSIPDQMGGWTVGWQGIPGPPNPPAVTVLQGIEKTAPSGVKVRSVTSMNPRTVASAARAASITVVVAGEKPYAEGMGDTDTAALDPADTSVIDAVLAAHRPLVVVLVAGRPLISNSIAQRADAILMAWLPGTEGGTAVGQALFGQVDPGGRLPVSWPKDIGQAPIFYTAYPGTSSVATRPYDPLYPFGYGLSYTTFSDQSLSTRFIGSGQSTIGADVTVQNTGHAAGDDVVEVYVHPDASAVLQPPRKLIAFQRVHLAAGATTTVHLQIPSSRLAEVPGDIPGDQLLTVESGQYTFMAGSQTSTLTISQSTAVRR